MSATATAARSKDRSSSATQKFFRKLHLNHGKSSNVAQQQDTVQQQNIKPNKQTKGKNHLYFSTTLLFLTVFLQQKQLSSTHKRKQSD